MVLVEDTYYRSMWIATFIHAVFFVLISLVAVFLSNRVNGIRLNSNTPREGEPSTLAGRVHDACRVVRDTLLVLFIAVVATGVGFGATNTTAILTWVGVVCSVIAVVTAAAVPNPIVPAVVMVPAYLFFLSVFGLAFRQLDGKV